MNFTARMLTFAPVSMTIAGIMVGCGGSTSWSPGSSSGGGSSGSGAVPGGSSGGVLTGVSSSGDIPAGNDWGTTANDGGANSAYRDPTRQANGLVCAPPGSTRTCCQTGTTIGTQTCNPAGEFSLWGPCVDSSGTALMCGSVNGCSPGEIDSTCDGGTSSSSGGSGGGSGSGGTPPPLPSVCTDPSVNTEPGILLAYSPPPGTSVATNGVIKVWVNDEGAPFVAPGEQVDSTTGAVTAPGNRSAAAADGLLYEPALYFAPGTPLNGAMPYFPSWIKGQYNNQPPTVGPYETSCCMDPLPFTGRDRYSVEYIWDVSKMNLGPGTYTALFVIHDGDRDRGIGCVTIQVK